MRRSRSSNSAVLLLLLGGCSLAPAEHRPELALPAAYKEAAPGGPWRLAGTDVPPPGQWWQAFGDPVLNDLEAKLDSGNFTLVAAAARYAQARGALRQAQAALLPEVDVGANVSRNRVSQGRPLSTGQAATYNDPQVGASLSYELDLFGRIRNSAHAASASAEASAADMAAARLALQAQLASVYFDLRGMDARVTLLRETVNAYQRAWELTDTRHRGGIDAGIDVSRAQSQLSSAKAELSSVLITRQTDEHAIALLLGETPANFTIPAATVRTLPPPIPLSLPSTLLERRPDIVAAERRVAAANAQIGVARAALYPDITLGASGGWQAASGALFSAANTFWGLGPLQAAMAIFDGGKRRAGVRIARAQYDETVADYRQTVLTAFREVEDDLATSRLLVQQEKDQADTAAAADKTLDLALTSYHDGATNYLEVVTAQTAALDAERALLDVRTRQLQTATDSFRALGGGYQQAATAK